MIPWLPLAGCIPSAATLRWMNLVRFPRRTWRTGRSESGHVYLRAGGRSRAVVHGGTVDAGVVHADQHQHLLVVLAAHHARQYLLIRHGLFKL